VPWSPKSASASSIDLPVPLAGVPPGPYRLVVTATNGPRTATREVAIRVE